MKLQNIVLAVAISGALAKQGVDVSKGTDVIPPDSAEAEALMHSDKAVKTSPKDNTYAEALEGGDKFSKSEPKLDHQKLDIPDTDQKEKDGKDEAVVKSDDHAVVLNDYDPNNIGASTEKDPRPDATKPGKADETSSVNESVSSEKSSSGTSSSSSSTDKSGNAKAGGFHSFTMAASMILFSEIGDKTFLIAALMAMKHARLTVFTSAFASLIVMSILSAFLGHALPALLPKKMTSLLAAVLFVIFGIKLMREGLQMEPGTGVEEELEEVEHEIAEKEMAARDDDLERGLSEKNASLKRASSSPRLSGDGLESSGDGLLYHGRRTGASTSTWQQFTEGVGNLAGLVLSPIWVQVFVMTFLGEWGDRSQVATIAMAAGSDYWFVILGAIAGHAVCTGTAVIGGRLLATKISMRHVTIAGALAFLVFAVIYFIEGVSLEW